MTIDGADSIEPANPPEPEIRGSAAGIVTMALIVVALVLVALIFVGVLFYLRNQPPSLSNAQRTWCADINNATAMQSAAARVGVDEGLVGAATIYLNTGLTPTNEEEAAFARACVEAHPG